MAYKKAKHVCNSTNKKAKKDYFSKVTGKGFMSNKSFWDTVKPFMTNKGIIANDQIKIENEETTKIKMPGTNKEITLNINEQINDENILVELFNSHYIDIVEKTSGTPPKIIGNPTDPKVDKKR